MNISELIVGHRALLQHSQSEKEIVKIKGLLPGGLVAVQLSNNNHDIVHPENIVKIFKTDSTWK